MEKSVLYRIGEEDEVCFDLGEILGFWRSKKAFLRKNRDGFWR